MRYKIRSVPINSAPSLAALPNFVEPPHLPSRKLARRLLSLRENPLPRLRAMERPASESAHTKLSFMCVLWPLWFCGSASDRGCRRSMEGKVDEYGKIVCRLKFTREGSGGDRHGEGCWLSVSRFWDGLSELGHTDVVVELEV